MPLYEEKLISPLAVRYTQEHIKTIFRDGHVVEDTIAQVETRPGEGDYDVVLHAPFPQIEIIRWGAIVGEDGGHWFTLDNRRLYCLQRVAAKLWPLRVAAKVEILYCDLRVVKRKFDSTTLGASVTIAHSCKDAPLFRFDWRTEIGSGQSPAERAALQAVQLDDDKEEVDDLTGIGGTSAEPDSILARAMQHEMSLTNAPAAKLRSPTPSTEAVSEDSSDGTPRRSEAWSFEKARDGRQLASGDAKHDSRAMQATQALLEITHQLRAPGSDGRLRIANWNERYGRRLGSLRRFLEARPDIFVVIPEREGKFRVREVTDEADGTDSAAWTGQVNESAEYAIAEIEAQLTNQGGEGNVRINDWNGRYAQSLGPFKAFIRSRPDKFEIVPSSNRFFKVALV